MKRRLALAFATVATTALLTGCGPNDVGPAAEKDELKGDIRTEVVFTGGPEQPHTTLSANFLEAGKHYRAEGKLTINGDVPEETTISVQNGELVINGSVGAGSRLNVGVPIVTHRQSYSSICLQYNAALKMSISQPCTKYKTVVDGLKYDDPDPAITVTGRAGEDVTYSTHGAVRVRGRTVQPAIAIYNK